MQHNNAINKLFELTPRSLRSRYLLATAIISLALIAFALFGWYQTQTLTNAQFNSLQQRADATDSMDSVVKQTHILETQFYRFITLPSQESRQIIERTFALHQNAIEKLRDNEWIKRDPALTELTIALQNDHIELENEIANLLDVRTDENKWFPAMSIMQGKMLNHNQQFMASLQLVLQEYSYNLASPDRQEIYRLLNEVRYYWQLMIGEFRLFIANSFGVFASDPERGMDTRRQNIVLYIDRVRDLLDELDKRDKAGKLDLVSQSSLSEMRHWLNEWQKAYVQVENSYQKRIWRHDLLLLQDKVEPILSRIRQRTSSLQLELGVASAKEITNLTSVARSFSDYVVYISLGLMVIGLIGFLIFHRSILRPISDVAQALKDEANGRQKIRVPLSNAEEIRDLTSAFAQMREQIRTREAHLDHMAHYDALTALPNRMMFQHRLNEAITNAIRNGTQAGLLFLDLDRFKQINDTLGHDIGDKLLKEVGKRLNNNLRSTDIVARLGGDEFAVIIDQVNHPDQIVATANKLLRAFNDPFNIDEHELYTSTSIGIALGPKDARDVESLVKHADIAMYHAKAIGRNVFKFYSLEMADEVMHHVTLESQLRSAIENREFTLHYQPIIDLRSGQIISTEALLRWNHPDRGLVSPAEFLPVLIDSGLIKPVTQWVLIEASQQYLRYKQAGFPNIRIAVNFSGFVFRNDSILDVILTAIEHTGMDPRGLIVEITEDTLMEDLTSAQHALTHLRNMGITIALDDFGTGQSSLNHLRHNPIDIVKIDRDFINNVPSDRGDSDLVDAIIAMAHKLHIRVVAEGVENKPQLDFLLWHKCDAIQGYLFSPAVPADTLLEMLSQDRRMLG